MKGQLWLLGLATLVALVVGGERWRARFARERELTSSEREGSWTLWVSEPGSELQGFTHDGSQQEGPAFHANNPGQFDLDPARGWLAYVEGGSYTGGGSSLRVVNRAGRTLGRTNAASGELWCPLLAGDRVLWVEGSFPALRFLEADVPGHDRTIQGREIFLPGNLNIAEDCPELSRDGKTLAWAGSDGRLHLAPFGGDSLAGPDQRFQGVTDFELSPNGGWLALNDGGRLYTLDPGSGARSLISAQAHPQRLLAISPDGRWVAVQSEGTFSPVAYEAWRVPDGGKVDLGLPSGSLYLRSADRLLRWMERH